MSGNGQVGRAGAPLDEAIGLAAVDDHGRPLEHHDVEWEVGDGGFVNEEFTRTDAQGRTAVEWTLGPRAGVQGVRARVQGRGVVSFSAVAEGSAPATGECGSPAPEWLWCDDFETDRLSGYFEYDDANGAFVRAMGVGRNGTPGMRVRFAEGQVSAGSLKLAFGRTPDGYIAPVDDGSLDHTEIYWRIYIRKAEDWVGGGGDKLSRVTSLVSPSWAQSMIGHIWSGRGDDAVLLVMDPASGTNASGQVVTTRYNDFDNLKWIGLGRGKTPLFDSSSVGEWHCVEARVRLNTPGASDGIFEFWVNDRLEARRADLNWRDTFVGYGINAMFLENYWDDGAPRAQERYFDNLVVSTARIGC